MVLVGVELKTLVSKPDTLNTRLPPCAINTTSVINTTLVITYFYHYIRLELAATLVFVRTFIKVSFCQNIRIRVL